MDSLSDSIDGIGLIYFKVHTKMADDCLCRWDIGGGASFSSLSEWISPDLPLCLPLWQAYASGCDVVILGSDFERLQIIPGAKHGNIQVGCVDCSLDGGRVRAAWLLVTETPFGSGQFHRLKKSPNARMWI